VTIGIEAPEEVRIIRGELKATADQFRAGAPAREPAPALAWTSGGYERTADSATASVPRLAK
jgi:hypothetical protein